MPREHGHAEPIGDVLRQHGLAGPRLPFQEQRPLECNGAVDRIDKWTGSDVPRRPLETQKPIFPMQQKYRSVTIHSSSSSGRSQDRGLVLVLAKGNHCLPDVFLPPPGQPGIAQQLDDPSGARRTRDATAGETFYKYPYRLNEDP